MFGSVSSMEQDLMTEPKVLFPTQPKRTHTLLAPQFLGSQVQIHASSGSLSRQSGGVQLKIDRSRNTGTIQNLRVDPEHRRQGLGTRLMQAAVAQAKLQGLSELRLEARSTEMGVSSVTLAGFYRRMGFREDGPAPNGGPRMSLLLGGNVHQAASVQAKYPAAAHRAVVPAAARAFVGATSTTPFSPVRVVQRKPVFAPVPQRPASTAKTPHAWGRGGVLQRAATSSVSVGDTYFTQATIGSNFTSIGTQTDKALFAVERAASDLRKLKTGVQRPSWLLNLSVFKITSPTSGESGTYSLDNRRLYVLKEGGATDFTPVWVNQQTMYGDLYKLTAQWDSLGIKVTDTAKGTDMPADWSLLGQFLRAILAAVGVTTVAAKPAWSPTVATQVGAVCTSYQYNV